MTTSPSNKGARAVTVVIEYLEHDERVHYEGCTRSERRIHIWRAVKVLMAHRGFAVPRSGPASDVEAAELAEA